jgi:hypothetical protein
MSVGTDSFVVMPEEIESLSDALRASAGGLALAASLAPLDSADVRSDHDLLEVIAAWERVISWAQEAQLAAVAEFVRRPLVVGPDPQEGWAKRAGVGKIVREFAEDELAARLSTSRVAASTRIDIAVSLARTLPATREALSAGRVDLARARVIVDETRHLDVETAGEVERIVLARATGQNCGRLRESVRRAAIIADPTIARTRVAKAKLERKVGIRPLPDDMAELWAVLPAPQAIAIDTALTAIARATKARRGRAEPRTIDQLRADALVAPFERAIRTGVAPRGGEFADLPLATVRGSRAQLNVTLPASVLLGISDYPGYLAGYGPITSDTARLIAGDATWRRLLTDPASGTVLDVGTTTYRPPAPLDRHVKTRDARCRGAGCNWPARLCESDHTIPFPEGPTAANNLGALCKRHHLAKHTPGRTLRQIAPGVFTWTMPTGHTYTVEPEAAAPPLSDELAVRAHNAPPVKRRRGDRPPSEPPRDKRPRDEGRGDRPPDEPPRGDRPRDERPRDERLTEAPRSAPDAERTGDLRGGKRKRRSPCEWARRKKGPAP